MSPLRISPICSWMVMLCFCIPVSAQVNSIDIVDGNGDSCVQMVVGTPTDLFVRANYDLPDGLVSASFRVLGMPPEWSVTATPNPLANVVIGDMLLDGVQVGFPVCPPGNQIDLFTLSVTPTTTQVVSLELTAIANPPTPNENCPHFFTGCGPVDVVVCVADGVRAIINDPGDCLVPVAEVAWTQMKQLFK